LTYTSAFTSSQLISQAKHYKALLLGQKKSLRNNLALASYNPNSAAVSSTEINQMSVRDAVFSTYELLEAILLDIPAEDILFAAKVNCTWHSVIASSTSIRQHLQANLQARRPYANHNPASEDYYVSRQFIWAWVLIRRVGGCDGIALLPTKSPRPRWARWTPLARAVIVDGKDVKLDITWDAKLEGWKLQFCDETEGICNSGFVESAGSGVDTGRYLERYYGGYCQTKRKLLS
jgi:hypothetical protein